MGVKLIFSSLREEHCLMVVRRIFGPKRVRVNVRRDLLNRLWPLPPLSFQNLLLTSIHNINNTNS